MAKNIKVTLTLDDRDFQRKVKNAKTSMDGVGRTGTGLIGMFGRLGPAIAGAFTIGAVVKFGQAIREATIEIENIRNGLRLVTNGAEDLDRVMNILTRTAIANRTGFAETAELFTKLRVATGELGRSEEDVIAVTSQLSRALQLAGADGNTAASVIRQFGQAMASGEVRGDEFRSLVEGLGPALAIMARETGISVGKLREMSQAGELTADVMFDMLMNSEALRTEFAKLNSTTDQLETALGDAFNRFLVKVGEASGVTAAYQTAVKSLTRELDRLAETESSPVNMSTEQLVQGVKDGKVELISAIEEIETRIKDAGIAYGQLFAGAASGSATIMMGAFEGLGADTEELQATLQYLQELKTAREAEANALAEQARLDREADAAKQQLLGRYQAEIDAAKELTKNIYDFRTEQEKVNDRVTAAEALMGRFRELFLESGEATGTATEMGEQFRNFLKGIGVDYDTLVNEIYAAKLAQAEYNDSLKTGNEGLSDYQIYLKDLLKDMVAFTTEQEFAKKALEEAELSFAAGTITLTEYNYLLETLNRILGITPEKIDPVKKLMEDLNKEFAEIDTLEEFVIMQEKLQELFKTGVITLAQYNELLRILRGEYTDVDEGTAAVISGIEKLNEGLSRDLADAIVNGKDLMDSMKDTFKSVITDMIAEAFRLRVIQPLLASIFGGSFGAGGVYTPGGGGIFSGIVSAIFGKANGGPVSINQPYIVGERGPELFVPGQSGNIVPNGQMGQTVINISAVDTQSFKTALAKQDPEFIFALSQAGARRLPA